MIIEGESFRYVIFSQFKTNWRSHNNSYFDYDFLLNDLYFNITFEKPSPLIDSKSAWKKLTTLYSVQSQMTARVEIRHTLIYKETWFKIRKKPIQKEFDYFKLI